MPKPSAEKRAKPTARSIMSELTGIAIAEWAVTKGERELIESAIAAMDAHYAELVRAAREVVDDATACSFQVAGADDVDVERKFIDALAAALRGLE